MEAQAEGLQLTVEGPRPVFHCRQAAVYTVTLSRRPISVPIIKHFPNFYDRRAKQFARSYTHTYTHTYLFCSKKNDEREKHKDNQYGADKAREALTAALKQKKRTVALEVGIIQTLKDAKICPAVFTN